MEGKDAELEVAYRHLLSKPPHEVDQLIKQSFKVDIAPHPGTKAPSPPANPIQCVTLSTASNIHRPGANRFAPSAGNFAPPSQPYTPPSFGSGMNFPMQPVQFWHLYRVLTDSRPPTLPRRIHKTNQISTSLGIPLFLLTAPSRSPSNKP